ncbi:hypothetical protein [Halococcus sp. IIIV-5B]|uniref:hypothetical protein n=1 Tax=Halococcus sp. IIIV-5B TaxID=2321230 RepID=UPI000E708E7A|nr:hypothetical protein [Halococcus sp. IIIV-5B]RJT07088.1 hypothetical protein D3261_03505 [Halococcus sp. IIIV-5B]
MIDDGECVEQPSHEIELVVGLCYRLDCVGVIDSEPRPNPLVAPEVLLEEGLVILSVAAKRLGNLGSMVKMNINISMSSWAICVIETTAEKVLLSNIVVFWLQNDNGLCKISVRFYLAFYIVI